MSAEPSPRAGALRAHAVVKEYRDRSTGHSKILRGSYRTSASMAEVRRAMAAREIQTIDPSIEWDENFAEGAGWDYVDWSFRLARFCEDTEIKLLRVVACQTNANRVSSTTMRPGRRISGPQDSWPCNVIESCP